MTRPARIPSDIHRPDRVVGPFTARQAAILAATGAALYLLWTVARGLVAPAVFLAGAIPVAALALVVVLGHRDGLSLDRLLLAAVRHRLTPRAPAPRPNPSDAPSAEGIPEWINAGATVADEPSPAPGRRLSGFPARAVTPAHAPRGSGGVGVVDLGPDGLVVIAVVSTVNFALRTPAEQDGLVAGFARYLHTLTGPIQILIRALPVDLRSHLHQLHSHARHLPHPALAAAAHDHLEHLARLGHRDGDQQLLTRQVLLVLREPHQGPVAGRDQPASRAGEHRLLRRLHDATTLLAPLDITVTALDAARTTALLTHICNPDHPGLARPDVEPDIVVRGTAYVAADDQDKAGGDLDGHGTHSRPAHDHEFGDGHYEDLSTEDLSTEDLSTEDLSTDDDASALCDEKWQRRRGTGRPSRRSAIGGAARRWSR